MTMTSREVFDAIWRDLIEVYREDPDKARRAVIRWAASIRGTWEVYQVAPYARAAWMRRREQAWLWQPH